MRAYLIDPENNTITTVDYDGDYRSIYKLVGCQTFDAARFKNNGDAVFVDDEGLLNDPENFFQITGYCQPLAGRGLVLGCDSNGDSKEPSVSLAWLIANVVFFNRIGNTLLASHASQWPQEKESVR